MAATVFAKVDEVIVYDSVYNSVDAETADVLRNIFGNSVSYSVANIVKQKGGKDCGLYAIAISILLCLNFVIHRKGCYCKWG